MAKDVSTTQDRPLAPTPLTLRARMVRAAAVGATLGVVGLLVLYGPQNDCRAQGGWGCLGLVLLFIWAAPVVGGLLSWALLRRAGVRPAWQVAVTGTLIGWLVLQLYERVFGDNGWGSWALPFLLAASYLMAAYVVAPGITPSRRLAVGVALILAWPLTGFIGYR